MVLSTFWQIFGMMNTLLSSRHDFFSTHKNFVGIRIFLFQTKELQIESFSSILPNTLLFGSGMYRTVEQLVDIYPECRNPYLTIWSDAVTFGFKLLFLNCDLLHRDIFILLLSLIVSIISPLGCSNHVHHQFVRPPGDAFQLIPVIPDV